MGNKIKDMKKNIITGISFLATTVGFAQPPVMQEKADSIIDSYISREITDDYILYFYTGTETKQPSNKRQSYLYFIDEMPNAYWNHPCRYVTIHPCSGEIETRHSQYPPSWTGWRRINSPAVEINHTSSLPEIPMVELFKDLPPKASESDNLGNYAIILSGGKDKTMNNHASWNDCAFMYTTLVHRYGYKPENVHTLISDGDDPADDISENQVHADGTGIYSNSSTDLDGDGKPDTRYSATKENLFLVFETFQSTLEEDDNLFIYITNHGANTGGESYTYLWHDSLFAHELAAKLDKIKAGTITVLMQCCYSGGFVPYIQDSNRVIITASSALQESHMQTDKGYGIFSNLWTEAMAGINRTGYKKVDADENHDGIVSMEEAFFYAQKNDNAPETPQYSSIPSELGKRLGLPGYSITKLKNTIISQDKTIKDRFIEVSNTTIKKGAKLTLDHSVATRLEAGFSMEPGSELEIK